MNEEEKDIEYLEKYINWETYGERSLEKAIETILRLYKAEKEKNNELESENLIWKGKYHLLSRKINVISKDKIKAKIEYNKTFNDDIHKYTTLTLQELLEE